MQAKVNSDSGSLPWYHDMARHQTVETSERVWKCQKRNKRLIHLWLIFLKIQCLSLIVVKQHLKLLQEFAWKEVADIAVIKAGTRRTWSPQSFICKVLCCWNPRAPELFRISWLDKVANVILLQSCSPGWCIWVHVVVTLLLLVWKKYKWSHQLPTAQYRTLECLIQHLFLMFN